jgi:hypothetical protein
MTTVANLHSVLASDGAIGGMTLTGGRAPRTARAGRVCEHPSCSTVLSIYNQSEGCAEHSKPVDLRRTLGVQVPSAR